MVLFEMYGKYFSEKSFLTRDRIYVCWYNSPQCLLLNTYYVHVHFRERREKKIAMVLESSFSKRIYFPKNVHI